MSVALFVVLAILGAAAIAQPLLPGSRLSQPMPDARRRGAGQARATSHQKKPVGTCPACGASVEPGDLFCVKCGGRLEVAPTARECAHCGAALDQGDRFCRNCGGGVVIAHEVQE